MAADGSLASAASPVAADRVQAARCVDFLLTIGALKTNKRTGWIRSGVAGPESISDHMYRMAVATLLVQDAGIDSMKACRIALAHDIAEAIVGDITPHDGVPKAEKSRLERNAMDTLRQQLGDNPAGQLLYDSWMEYEAGMSREAQIVKDIDKVEMIIQAFEYERDQPRLQLSDFYDSVRGRLQTRTGDLWAQDVLQRRVQLHADRIGLAGEQVPYPLTVATKTRPVASASVSFFVGVAAGAGCVLLVLLWRRLKS